LNYITKEVNEVSYVRWFFLKKLLLFMCYHMKNVLISGNKCDTAL